MDLPHDHPCVHSHTIQSWLIGLLPQRVWISSAMYFNKTARKRCLEGPPPNGQLFSRKKQVLAPPPQRRPRHYSNSRRPELSLRRTPSPHRRVSTIESQNMQQPAQEKLSNAGHARPVPTEENGVATPYRADTGSSSSSVPSPTVHDDPLASTLLSTADLASPPQAPSSGFIPATVPQRSVSASSTESITSKKSPVIRRPKHSRVLVVPSVATVTFLPQRNRDQPSS